jgi:thiol-disulfide isomerase/thioredoxin
MSFYLLPNNLAALRTAFATEATKNGVSVVCYCAEWCDTCRQYLDDFQSLARQWPHHTFIWVDIEENPEFLDDEDVENFPTVLIQDSDGNRFFGPLLPHIGHLDTLLRKAAGLPASSAGPGPVATLVNTGN